MDGEAIIGYFEAQAEIRRPAVTERNGALHVNQALCRLRLEHLARLTETAGEIAEAFSLEIAIGFLYYEVLGRPPDPSGFSHYLAATGGRQLTFADIVAGMVASEEFLNRFPYMRESD
jgi:uncharacterized protein DUF4214